MPVIDRHSLKRLVNAVFRRLMDIEVSGQEHLPLTGGCILTTNHLSRLDTPLFLTCANRDDFCALVTDKYRSNPFFALFIKITSSIWINREIADHAAIRAALSKIKAGWMLGIAPEGTRSRVGSLIQAKSGTVLLAERAGVQIIPVGIQGTEECMAKLRRFNRPSIKVSYGAAYSMPSIDRNDRESSVRRNTDEMMCRIAALLPEQYHGFYRGNPRITEIQKEGIS